MAKQIAGDLKLRAAAESMHDALQKLQAPMGLGKDGAKAIYVAMQPLVIHFGMPKKATAELSVWWKGYYDAFAELPLEALEHAVSEYIRTSQIHMVPGAGVLTKLAMNRAVEIRVAAWRVKKALELPPPKPEMTQEERDKMGADMREFARTFKSGPRMPADPQPPSVSPQQAAERIRRSL